MATHKRSLFRELMSGVEEMGAHREGRVTLKRHVIKCTGRSRRGVAAGSEPITRGTGNVFADLGFPDAAGRQARLRLAHALNQLIDSRGLSERAAAKALGVTVTQFSALRGYKLAGFTIERLIKLLAALDRDVEIVIRKEPRSRA